jgi:hypothetical protein
LFILIFDGRKNKRRRRKQEGRMRKAVDIENREFATPKIVVQQQLKQSRAGRLFSLLFDIHVCWRTSA